MKGKKMRMVVRYGDEDKNQVIDFIESFGARVIVVYEGKNDNTYGIDATGWQWCKIRNEFRLRDSGIYKERMLRREMFI